MVSSLFRLRFSCIERLGHKIEFFAVEALLWSLRSTKKKWEAGLRTDMSHTKRKSDVGIRRLILST